MPSGFLDAVNAENQGGERGASRVHILVDRPLVDFFPLRYGRRRERPVSQIEGFDNAVVPLLALVYAVSQTTL